MKLLRNISFSSVNLENGFWQDRYRLNAAVSVENVYRRFEDTYRFEALRFTHKEGDGKTLHYFFDSDVAKWIEAVAYLIEKDRSGYTRYEAVIDALADSMEAHQREDGYLNSYFQQIAPEKIFTNINFHELYCIGHLIEAGIAYLQATGKQKLYNITKRMADCAYEVFFVRKSAGFSVPGHEEIELALMKLYRFSGEKKYLALAEHFIKTRGSSDNTAVCDFANYKYAQNEKSVYELTSAEGHAVRALYLYCGLADYAKDAEDERLLSVCKTLFDDIMKKMYVTGGLGSTHVGECFTLPYDLPNRTAYAESCAAISLLFFARRMAETELDGRYGAVIERVLYNSLLSSVSLDGKSFFYSNPLEIRRRDIDRETSIVKKSRTWSPNPDRSEVFSCSCCPPNINRAIASIGDVIFTEGDDFLAVNQFISATLSEASLGEVRISSAFPFEGTVEITVGAFQKKRLAVRKPEWCEAFSVKNNGNPIDFTEKNGYLFFANPTGTLSFDFEMPVRFIRANPLVAADCGRVCVQRGAMVFCAESADNGENLNALCIDTKAPVFLGFDENLGVMTLTAQGERSLGFDGLYTAEEIKHESTQITLIPYYAFANRGGDMLVWIPAK